MLGGNFIITIFSKLNNYKYKKLITYALKECNKFILVIRPNTYLDNIGQELLKELNPYLIKTLLSNEWPRTETEGEPSTLYYYDLNQKSKDILLHFSNDFSSWIHPELPEDLCFIKNNNHIWLYTSSHEETIWIENENEDDIEFLNSISVVDYSIE